MNISDDDDDNETFESVKNQSNTERNSAEITGQSDNNEQSEKEDDNDNDNINTDMLLMQLA